jgi:hypothetical protein
MSVLLPAAEVEAVLICDGGDRTGVEVVAETDGVVDGVRAGVFSPAASA